MTAVLASLDFRLVFSMPCQGSQDTLPPLPAQYHYRDRQGTEVIYLAGRDSPLLTGELSLPPHESRFWLSRGGSDSDTFRLVRARLAGRWHFQWKKAARGYDGDDAQEVA